MEEKRILTLRCCKNDFNEIVNNGVKFRYLEVKKYWESRVLDKEGNPKEFDLIKLQNGYNTDSPQAIIEFKGNKGIIEHEGVNCFKIELGKILEVKNY